MTKNISPLKLLDFTPRYKITKLINTIINVIKL